MTLGFFLFLLLFKQEYDYSSIFFEVFFFITHLYFF